MEKAFESAGLAARALTPAREALHRMSCRLSAAETRARNLQKAIEEIVKAHGENGLLPTSLRVGAALGQARQVLAEIKE